MTRTKIDLYDFASDLLEAAERSLVRAEIALPENRYVTYELPDLVCCDTLAVRHLAPRIREGSDKCSVSWTARVELTISRCVQVFTRDGELPPLSKVESDALDVYSDRWTLMRFLLEEYRCSNAPICGDPEIESVIEVNAANCAGSAFTVGLVMP